MKKFFKGLFNLLLTLVILAIVALGAGLVYLTVNEYSPDDTEAVVPYGSYTTDVNAGDKLKVMTYNIGYAALGENGGDSAGAINSSLADISKLSLDQYPHVIFFQEVDIDSRRSFSTDEASTLTNGIYGRMNVFANDFKCTWVPFPPQELIGKVDSGSLTLTRFNIDSAERRVAEDGETWPSSVWSRKPCLLVSRTKINESTKELVLININYSDIDDPTVRNTQYKELCEFMQIEYAKGSYVIAGGDFYATLPSVTKGANASQSEDISLFDISSDILTGGWKYCTDDTTPTVKIGEEEFVTDGFITSPNTIVENIKTTDTFFKYSDHNPVTAEVTLVK